jgi:hypothetical protein
VVGRVFLAVQIIELNVINFPRFLSTNRRPVKNPRISILHFKDGAPIQLIPLDVGSPHTKFTLHAGQVNQKDIDSGVIRHCQVFESDSFQKQLNHTCLAITHTLILTIISVFDSGSQLIIIDCQFSDSKLF